MLDPLKLKQRIAAAGFTALEAAGRANVTTSHMSALMDPNRAIDPSLAVVERLAAALGCSIVDLVTPGPPTDRARYIGKIKRNRGRPAQPDSVRSKRKARQEARAGETVVEVGVTPPNNLVEGWGT